MLLNGRALATRFLLPFESLSATGELKQAAPSLTRLTDNSGKIMLDGEFKFSGNEFSLPIDVENGVYFIQIRNEKMAYINKKMIVQR